MVYATATVEVYSAEGEVVRKFNGRNLDVIVERNDHDAVPSLCVPVAPRQVRAESKRRLALALLSHRLTAASYPFPLLTAQLDCRRPPQIQIPLKGNVGVFGTLIGRGQLTVRFCDASKRLLVQVCPLNACRAAPAHRICPTPLMFSILCTCRSCCPTLTPLASASSVPRWTALSAPTPRCAGKQQYV